MNFFITTIYAIKDENIESGGIPTLKGLEDVFAAILSLIIPFAGVALFLYIMLGGYQYITSGSNPQKAESAKNTITYAILGVIFLALAYLIINFIATFTGATYLREFRIRI